MRTYISVWWYENSMRAEDVVQRRIDKDGFVKYNRGKHKVRTHYKEGLGNSYHITLNPEQYLNLKENNYGGYICEDGILRGGSLAGKHIDECHRFITRGYYAHCR